MTKFLFVSLVGMLAAVIGSCELFEDPFAGSYSTGDEGPAGGIVIFVDTDREHDFDYIEVAPMDVPVPDGDANRASWSHNLLIGETGRGIGSGRGNTTRIIEVVASDRSDLSRYAARLADEFEHNGYSDWFLPSSSELELVYQYKDDTSGSFSPQAYWSSSEDNSTRAFSVNFGEFGGSVAQNGKTNIARIRAVRYFNESDL